MVPLVVNGAGRRTGGGMIQLVAVVMMVVGVVVVAGARRVSFLSNTAMRINKLVVLDLDCGSLELCSVFLFNTLYHTAT